MSDSGQQRGHEQHEQQVDLITILGIVYRYRWIVIVLTGAAAVGSVVFVIVSLALPQQYSPLPNRYTAQALVLVDDVEDVVRGADIFTQSGLARLPGLALPNRGGYGELAIRLLQGNAIVDTIIEDFDIAGHYEIKRFVKDNARKTVREHATVQFESETRTVSIAYEDIDAEFAANVVNRMVDLLGHRFSAIGINREARNRDMLHEKLVGIEQDIVDLEEEIQAFQRRYGTIDPQTYAREHITILAEMRAQLIAKEIEADTYAQLTRIEDPVASRLRVERKQLKQTIVDMEQRYFGDVDTGSENLPELAVRFGRLERELRVQGRIYEVLTQQYEVARLAAEGDELIFQVLEAADVPLLKSGPSRSAVVITTTFAAFCFSIVLVIVLNGIRNIRNDPNAIRRFRGEA